MKKRNAKPTRKRIVLFTGKSISLDAAIDALKSFRKWAVEYTHKDDWNCDVQYDVLPEIDRRIAALEKDAAKEGR